MFCIENHTGNKFIVVKEKLFTRTIRKSGLAHQMSHPYPSFILILEDLFVLYKFGLLTSSEA